MPHKRNKKIILRQEVRGLICNTEFESYSKPGHNVDVQ